MAFVTKSTSYLRFNNTSYKDYLAINGSSQSNATSFTGTEPTSGTTPDLYNGNIRQMVTSYLDALAPNKTDGLKSLLRNYTYDQLNRITSANSNDNLNTTTNTWGSPSITGLYAETFTYDQNGNILTLNRKGNLSGSQQHMDDLKYHYIANTNKLDYVTDLVTANNYSDDIKNGQTSGNYQYDAIGNLTKDEQEHISDIKWTVYGKIKKITKSSGPVSEINFDYDASGNRISKNVVYNNGNSNTIYYIRDAQGNTMATYENNIVPSTSNTYSLTEHHIYGSSRLGMNINKIDPRVVLSNGNYFTRNVDQISYELSNHLGNVVATVNAKKIAVENTNDNVVDYFSGEILSGTDYYSFGSPMPSRQFSAGSPYKYGMNGQEKDDDIFIGAYTAEFWEYDSRIGRRWNIDPKGNLWESTFATFGNNPIVNIDIKGDKWGKKGDKEQTAKDEKHAEELRKKFEEKKADFTNKLGELQSQYDKIADKGSKEAMDLSKGILDAKSGIMDMEAGLNELKEMGEDEEHYFTFEQVTIHPNDGIKELHPKVNKNNDGTWQITIPYSYGAGSMMGTKSHETKHGYDFFQINKYGMTMTKYELERNAYKRQYFIDKYSLPAPLINVKHAKEINQELIEQIKTVNGKPLYNFN